MYEIGHFVNRNAVFVNNFKKGNPRPCLTPLKRPRKSQLLLSLLAMLLLLHLPQRLILFSLHLLQMLQKLPPARL